MTATPSKPAPEPPCPGCEGQGYMHYGACQQQPAPDAMREVLEEGIRLHCRQLGNAVLQDSGGIERIYYSGISVRALAKTIQYHLDLSAPVPPADGARCACTQIGGDPLGNCEVCDLSSSLNQEAKEHPPFDNPRDLYASPNRLSSPAVAAEPGASHRLQVADQLIGIQEDLPNEDDRNVLGFAAHYLRQARHSSSENKS